MIRLLLDEHIPHAVAVSLRTRAKNISVVPVSDWEGGVYLGAEDEDLLRAARELDFILVSFDLHTIPDLLRTWAERGEDHGGVIFVNVRTFRQADVGGLSRALEKLAREEGHRDWTNRVHFLERSRG